MLEFDSDKIDAFLAKLDGAESEAKRAGNIAIEKTTNWLKEEATKTISQQTHISPEVLNNRLYESTDKEKITGRLYIGTKKVNFMRLSPTQTASGVQAGDITIDHAFIAPCVKGSNKKVVYVRTGEFVEATKGRYEGKIREKLQKQVLTIDKAASNTIESLLDQTESKLVENIKQELNFNGR